MYLGYEKIKSIATGMKVMDLFPSGSTFDVKNIWVHSYEVAFLAAGVSDRVRMTSPRESFLSGLLHDIGRIVFYKLDSRLFTAILTSDDMLDRA